MKPYVICSSHILFRAFVIGTMSIKSRRSVAKVSSLLTPSSLISGGGVVFGWGGGPGRRNKDRWWMTNDV